MKAIALGAALFFVLTVPLSVGAQDAGSLQPPDSFLSISDKDTRSVALFEELAQVITHPRCMNCHPRSDTPTQGMEMVPHYPPVARNEDGFGAPGMDCSSCHQDENVEFVGARGSVPGNAHWHLAPLSMGWVGLSTGDICRQLKDPNRNGGRTLAELVTHHAQDPLVGWAWDPGAGREPPPGSQAELEALTAAWVATGARCPA